MQGYITGLLGFATFIHLIAAGRATAMEDGVGFVADIVCAAAFATALYGHVVVGG